MSKRRYTPEEIIDMLDRATSEDLDWSDNDDEEGVLDGDSGLREGMLDGDSGLRGVEEELVSENETDAILNPDEAHVMQIVSEVQISEIVVPTSSYGPTVPFTPASSLLTSPIPLSNASSIMSDSNPATVSPSPSHSESPVDAMDELSPTASQTVAQPFSPSVFSSPVGPANILPSTAHAVDFFGLLFTDEMCTMIVDQTNLYARQHPPSGRSQWYDTCSSEIKAFFGTIIAMGLKVVPQLEDYWSTTNILGCPDIVKSFPRNRFQALLSTIHLNDNSQALPRDNPAFDKIFKVRKLVDMARESIHREYRPNRELSID